MRGSQRSIHTRFHVMEAAGLFASNPANPDSQDEDGQSLYKGPIAYPKMLYHPEGAERVLVPGEIILSPGGREIVVGEQKELIWKLVENEAEEGELLAQGWWRTPAQAIRAANDPKRPVPPESPSQIMNEQDARIRELEERLAALQSESKTSAKGKEAI